MDARSDEAIVLEALMKLPEPSVLECVHVAVAALRAHDRLRVPSPDAEAPRWNVLKEAVTAQVRRATTEEQDVAVVTLGILDAVERFDAVRPVAPTGPERAASDSVTIPREDAALILRAAAAMGSVKTNEEVMAVNRVRAKLRALASPRVENPDG
jgi:hypothetical protein